MAQICDSRDVLTILEEERVHAVFQPIYDLTHGTLFGFEGLIRGPVDGPFHNPLTLFAAAGREKRLTALETLCRRTVCRRFQAQRMPGKLFLNVTPMTLVESGYRSGITGEILATLGLDPSRVVIEITEQHPLDDYGLMRDATQHYRRQGFEIALDDLGAGYSSLRIWSEIRPDYVKIDRHFIENLAMDGPKQAFVRSIEGIARGLGCRVIAEGIETDAELRVLADIGVALGQGFGLGRPEPNPVAEAPLVLRSLHARRHQGFRSRRAPAAGALARPLPVFPPEAAAEQVLDRLRGERALTAAAVVQDGRVLGLVERDDLLEQFSGRYVRELLARKPIRSLLGRPSLCVDENESLEAVSRRLTEGHGGRLPQCFVVTRAGAYCGIARTRDLLERITQEQIRAARYSNPLTGLPGNVPLYEAIDERLAQGEPFAVAYFDLNQFKPFNDRFGYSQGDRVIQLVGDLLMHHADGARDFVGHIGGDDFVLIFRSEDAAARCHRVAECFDAQVRRFYDDEALAAGGVWSEDRRGQAVFFALLSLAVGLVEPDAALCRSRRAGNGRQARGEEAVGQLRVRVAAPRAGRNGRPGGAGRAGLARAPRGIAPGPQRRRHPALQWPPSTRTTTKTQTGITVAKYPVIHAAPTIPPQDARSVRRRFRRTARRRPLARRAANVEPPASQWLPSLAFHSPRSIARWMIWNGR